MPYESEHTKFMREWLQKHPEEIKDAKQRRALWWDKKPPKLEEMRRDQLAEVPPKAYYYDAN